MHAGCESFAADEACAIVRLVRKHGIATPANAMAVALMEAINPATIGRISPGMATAPSYRSLAISSNSLLLSISVAFESISMEPPVER